MLTKLEKQWLRKLEKLLMHPPSSRIAFSTVGDNGLTVFDQSIENIDPVGNEDFCHAIERRGALLGHVRSAMPIHSTAG